MFPLFSFTHSTLKSLRTKALGLKWCFLFFKKKNNIYLEPVGSVSPKVNAGDEMRFIRMRLGHSLSITANVQAYPVPAYL